MSSNVKGVADIVVHVDPLPSWAQDTPLPRTPEAQAMMMQTRPMDWAPAAREILFGRQGAQRVHVR